MKKIYVSCYDLITKTKPSGTVDLLRWLTEKKDAQIRILEQIRAGGLSKDQVNELKKKLPAITPSGTFSKRGVDGLLKHSNVICLDFDNIKNDLERIKKIICQNKSVFYCGISASGNGLCAMVFIENPDMHKQHFNALVELYANLGIEVDKQCSDVSRARFYAYDEEAYINHEPIVYTETLEKNTAQTSKIKKMKKTKNQTDELEKPTVSMELTIEEQFLRSSLENGPIKVKIVNASGKRLRILIAKIVSEKKDITVKRQDWFIEAAIINQNFPDDGRELFHAISCFYPSYDYEKADIFYTDCQSYHYNNELFFKIAEGYCISLED